MNTNPLRSIRQYKETVLENGLLVISSENPAMPITTIEVWIRGGSRYESPNQLGYAHILEHMLCQGTSRRPSSFLVHLERDRLGANFNAKTNREWVNFFIQIANQQAGQMFDLLSDMLLHSLLDHRVLDNEKKVIIEELHRFYDEPTRLLAILAQKNFFAGHPLSNTPIGEEATIKKANSRELRRYYEMFYTPQRAVLIVSGGLSHKDMLFLARKYFGGWVFDKKQIQQKNVPLKEIRSRYFFKRNTIKKTFLVINYYTPAASYVRKSAALDIVVTALTGGLSSLLSQELRVKRGLVYSISSYNALYAETGRFDISTSTTNPEETMRVIFNTMSALGHYFTEDLLSEIKIQIRNKFFLRIVHPLLEADFLGQNFIYHNKIIRPEDYLAEIDKVTFEDIKDVIKKYITPENCILTVVGPRDIKKSVSNFLR